MRKKVKYNEKAVTKRPCKSKFTSGYIGLKRKEYGNEDIERPWEDLAKHISIDDEIEPKTFQF